MPTFPSTATLRAVGPNQVIAIVMPPGSTEPPLQILNDDEDGVAEITIEGTLRTVAGSFWVRGPSIVEDAGVPL